MTINESRQHAIEMTRNYVEVIAFATGKTVDFYQLLWVMHWAIETYGTDKTRQALEDIMLSEDFEPDEMPKALRNLLFNQKIQDGRMEEWFNRAIGA